MADSNVESRVTLLESQVAWLYSKLSEHVHMETADYPVAPPADGKD
jgi:hypothetical protein